LDNFSVADERRATVQITVAGPPSIEVAPGEIVINFGISSFTSPLPNADVWEQMALDFAASDPKVGLVILDEALKTDVIELTTDYDCFYMDTNIVTNADVSWLRSLDPLLSSDLTFSPNDIVGDVLRQVQINDQTWAMPLMLQPAVMRYEPDISDQAGAYSPQGSWSVDQFEDALRMLALYLADDTIPYQPRSFDNSYLLMLIASYGGLPLDYRTDPLTIDFTAPDTIEAIRQVLDLAEEGYFEYIPLAGGDKFVIDGEIVVPLYGQILNTSTVGGGIAFDGKGGRGNSADSRRDQPTSNITTYPQSSQYVVALGQYTVVSYDLSAAYISDSTQHVEACYRFISEMAQNPDFITVMPVRYSAIDSPDILVAQGQSNVDFYNSLAETLLQANIIELPVSQTRLKAYGNYITTYWLNRVFDRYVLEDADLEEELADAELFTLAYLECANAIPPFDPATGDNQRQYYTQFNDCATQTDPTFGS